MSPPQRSAGFTLLEMLVVLAILGLMVGLLVGRGPMRSAGLNARSAANMLAGSLRAARSEAIATDRPVTVRINGAAGTVQVGAQPPHAMGAVLLPPAKPIVFAPDGSSTGGAVVIAAGSIRREVAVEWLTGRVSIVDAK